MKRLSCIAIAVISACLLAACGGSSGNTGTDDTNAFPISGLVGTFEGNLFKIDTRTGNATLLTGQGLLGAPDVRALAYDPNTNTLYGADTVTGLLLRIDRNTGGSSAIGPISSVVAGLAFDPNTNTLYGTDLISDILVKIDTQTAKTTLVGPLGTAGTVNMVGLAFDPNTNTLYATESTSNTLVRLDLSTGAPTTIGPTGISNIQGLSFDRNSHTLYGYSLDSNNLVSINTATGAATAIGGTMSYSPLGLAFDPNHNSLFGSTLDAELVSINTLNATSAPLSRMGGTYLQGLAYNAVTHILYGVDDIQDRLMRIDTATGKATDIGPVGFSDVHALAIDSGSNTLYGLNDATDQLIKINTATGAGTAVGISVVGMTTSLTYDPNASVLYAIQENTGGVYSIDVVTGTGTYLGFLLSGTDISSLTFDPGSNTLYGVDNNTDELVAIDVSAKNFSVVGKVNIDGIVGLSFDTDNNRLLATDKLQLYAINPDNAHASTIGAVGFAVNGIGFDTDTATIYASVADNSGGLLLTLDRISGAGSIIGRLGFNTVSSLTYDSDNHTLYGFDPTANRLLTIDTSTGAATAVANADLFPDTGFGIEYDPNSGTMYGIASAALYTIDTVSGVASHLHDSNSAIFAPAFDSANNTLYSMTYNEAADYQSLATIDTATGTATPVAQINGIFRDLVFLP